jgi:hypothetical protein
MRRFAPMRHAQHVLSVRAQVSNQFRPGRHLMQARHLAHADVGAVRHRGLRSPARAIRRRSLRRARVAYGRALVSPNGPPTWQYRRAMPPVEARQAPHGHGRRLALSTRVRGGSATSPSESARVQEACVAQASRLPVDLRQGMADVHHTELVAAMRQSQRATELVDGLFYRPRPED